MVTSMYAAIAGLRTHQSKMDVISNNIANVNTWGYKSKSANFQDAMYNNMIISTEGDVEGGGLGGVNASQVGYGVGLGSISANFGTGSWGFTGRGTDCMIDGTGFFIVGPMLEAGTTDAADLTDAGLSLSRVGIFSVDGNGYITDNQGNYVYGFEPDPANPEAFLTDNLVPIRIPEDPTSTTTPKERYDIQTLAIGTDGRIAGVDSENQKITIGQIAVASVENVNGLVQTAGYLFDIGNNAGQVSAIQTVATTTGKIMSNYLEMSNVDLATDMANMITTQRGYQANSKIITVTDEMLEQLVNMKR